MKRIFSILLILCMFISTALPMTAYAADTENPIGFSDSENTPSSEDAPEDSANTPIDELPGEGTPTDVPEETPEDISSDIPQVETPGDVPEDTPDEICDTPQISPFSEFTGEDNEFFTRIRLTVTDRDGNPLSDAVYGLYASGGTLIEYLTTDYYGVAVSGDVPVDTDYYIEEITPPTGFTPNTGRRDIILTEICAPSRVDITAVCDPIMGNIMIIKTDEYGNPLSGVGFYVYSSATGEHVDTILTGEDGTATTTELPYGWYELYEYLALEGFDGGGSYMAMVEYDGETAEVYVTNYLSRAYVSVNKTGNDERKIQGAVFSIYTAEGEWMEDITTNSSGYGYSSALVLGDYYAVEIGVPAGYELDTTEHPFTLYSAWQTVYLDVMNNRSGEPGKVKIIKTDDKDNPLSGVVFGLYRAWDGKKLADLTMGSDGTIESDLLIPQDYYLVELTGKDGYTMVLGQIPFTIDGSGMIVEKTVENPKIRIFGKVKVVKQDDVGTPIPGVKFGVYCNSGNLLEELTTGADGTATSGALNERTGYYLMELSGAPGHVSDTTTRYPFSITTNNTVVPVTVTNPRITGSVKVIKTGDSDEPLAGVMFGIYNQNGKIAELTTGADGTVTSETLYYGNYELRELSTVEGYELIDTPIPFSILEQGAVIEIPVSNPLIIGGIRILKTDGGEQTPVVQLSSMTSNNPLSGAVFGVYTEQGQLIAELTTGEDGRAEMNGLVMGNYYLREHVAPEGFIPIEEDIPFSITKQGEVVEKTIVNSVGYGTLKVIKSGEDEELLSGVVFEVYRESDSQKVSEITTDENGIAEIELPLGRYYLVETQTAIGYRLPEGGFSFALTTHGATVELPIQNQKEPIPEPGSVVIVKKNNCGELLPGAVFGIFRVSDDEKLAHLTTNGSGVTNGFALEAGEYYLLELAAPQGYKLSTDKVFFEISVGESKEIIVINIPEDVTPPDEKPGKLLIIKKADGTGELLKNAVFGVYRAFDDEKIMELTTDGYGEAKAELPVGEYYLRELKAPTGYKLTADRIKVSIKSDATKEITVTNKPEVTVTPPPVEKPGRLLIIKEADGTGELLKNAVFGVYRSSDDEKIAELTTGRYGEAKTELPAGEYYLRELKAPVGFKLTTDRIKVVIKSDITKEVTVTNKLESTVTPPPTEKPGNLLIIKKADGTGELLKNAVFGVYRASDDEIIAELTTDRYGEAKTELPVGEYYLRELKAPASFILSTDRISVKIKSGETKEIIVTNKTETAVTPTPTPTPTPSPKPTPKGELLIIKKAEQTGKALSGAVFGVYSAGDNKKITELTSNADGKATLSLSPDEYYLKELKAPYGYVLETVKIYFTVTANATVKVEITNLRDENIPDGDIPLGGIEIPKTGEDFPTVNYIWGSCLLAAALLMSGLTLYKRRRA